MRTQLTVLICASCLAASAAPAAEAGLGFVSGSDLMDLSLEQLMSIPVSSASGYEQHISDAPSSVTIVTRGDIEAFGYRTLADAVSSAAGFYSGYDRSYHSMGVRGFNRPGDYNTRMLVLINGMRVNEPIYGMGNVGGEFPVDIDLVERIEIVRGPSASLYGSAAFFAIINVITRDAEDVAPAEVSLAAGSHNAYRARVTGAHLFDGRGSLLVSGSILRSRGDDLHFPRYNDPESNDGVAEGVDGEDLESVFLHGTYGDLQLQATWRNRFKERPTASYGTLFNDPDGYDEDTEVAVSLSWAGNLSPAWGGLFRAGYQRYRYEAGWPYDYSEGEEEEEGLVRQPGLRRVSGRADGEDEESRYVDLDRSGSESLSAAAQVTARILPGHVMTAGFDLNRAYHIRQEYIEANEVVSDRTDDHTYIGAYLQDEIALGSWGLINAGLRYDRMEPYGHHRFSPRTALVTRTSAVTTLKLIYGEAFRTPNAYELHYDDGEDGVMKPNPDLEPETIRTWEAVVEHDLTEHLRLNLSLYSYRIEGLISQEQDSGDGMLVFGNLDAAVATGGELTAIADLPRGVRAWMSYGYSEATDRVGDRRLSNSPGHLAKLNLIAPVVDTRLTVSVEAQYIGERYTVEREKVCDAVVVNSTLRCRRFRNLETLLSVYNLFDRSYAHPVGREIAGGLVEQDGRTFRLKATYAF